MEASEGDVVAEVAVSVGNVSRAFASLKRNEHDTLADHEAATTRTIPVIALTKSDGPAT